MNTPKIILSSHYGHITIRFCFIKLGSDVIINALYPAFIFIPPLHLDNT